MKGLSRRSWKTCLALAGFLSMAPSFGASLSAQTSDRHLEGIVLDQQALPVPGAQIVVTQQHGSLRKTAVSTTAQFRIDGLVPAIYEVRVAAPGFALKIETVDLRTAQETTLDIRLEPGRVSEQVIVTPARIEQALGRRARQCLGAGQRRNPAVARRRGRRCPASDSDVQPLPPHQQPLLPSDLAGRVASRDRAERHRAARSCCIDDVPFNDPFGGWVYWTRVPLMSVDRIEVVDGSNSSLYGNYAMGGVINIATSQPARRTIEFKPQYGSNGSPKFDLFASDRWNKVGVAVEGSIFNTDGYPVVAASERGPIDNNATVDFRNVSAKVDYTPTDRISAFFRGGYFTEDRVNAKVGEVNDTRWTTASGGVRIRLPDESNLQARVFVDNQNVPQHFLAVTNPTTTRNLVRLATDQNVPVNGVGGMAQWSKTLGGVPRVQRGHRLALGRWRQRGGCVRRRQSPPSSWASTQTATLTTQRVSGGTQQSFGAFVQDIFTPAPKVAITLSARVDRWRNYDAHNLETTVATGLPTANNKPSLPDKDDTVVSPRVAAIFHATDQVSVWGDFGLGFRAPTLNELYRQFSVGAVLTRPNDQLGPERLRGGEIGVNRHAGAQRHGARDLVRQSRGGSDFERDDRDEPAAAPESRQDAHLGHSDRRGVPPRLVLEIFRRLSLRSGQGDGDRRESRAGRKFLPQVPEHRGSIQLAYANPTVLHVAGGIQFLGQAVRRRSECAGGAGGCA